MYVPACSIAFTDDEIGTVIFDQYKKRAFSVWIIDMPQVKSKWIKGSAIVRIS